VLILAILVSLLMLGAHGWWAAALTLAAFAAMGHARNLYKRKYTRRSR
jgi:hypothetical protein